MVQTAHTSELDATTLQAAHALLADVFEGELTAEDWEHCLGGMHALAYDGDDLVGHAALIQRRLFHQGRALRTGYVEGVGVRADARRRGHAGAMMAELERMIRAAYDVGALGASEDGVAFYLSRGWRRWEGPTSMLTPDGIVATEEEDGWIFVLEADAPLDFGGALTCDWRDGDAW